MKNIILISLLILSFGFKSNMDKDPCRKSFKKEHRKKSKSISFSNDVIFETKGIGIDMRHARGMAFSFAYFNDTTHLVINTSFNKRMTTFKRNFNFTKETIVSLIFKDGTMFKFPFTNMVTTYSKTTYFDFSNSKIVVSSEFLNKISSTELMKIEILNPFAYTVNANIVYSKIVKSNSNRYLNKYSNCFIDRVKYI